MKNKILNKMLDFIGLEETYEGGRAVHDDDAYEEEEELEEEPTSRWGRRRAAREEREAEPEYEPEPTPMPRPSRSRGKVVAMPNTNAMRMVVYQPLSYDDAQNVIDNLRAGKPVVVNLSVLEIDTAQRVLDFISGAIYSLNGSIQGWIKGIFVVAPANVDVSGNISEESKGRFYTINPNGTRD